MDTPAYSALQANSNYDLAEFEKLVEEGYLRKVESGPLVLYNYTDKCTYGKKWDSKYTRDARGIIFEKSTGNLVAKPFPKFFNLGEMEETALLNLPVDSSYSTTDKIDGSLGIIYHYNGELHVATRGSFNSEQAVKAKEILKNYRQEWLIPGATYLVEIIYPENKIVVDYAGEEVLVLLGAYRGDNEHSREYLETIGELTGIPLAQEYSHTIEEMIELKKTMPKDEEGFVVRFANGLRVKIKGDEYLRIHKLISTMSPISFWESMKDGVVNKDYVVQLPEEFRQEFEPIIQSLEDTYANTLREIKDDVKRLPVLDLSTKENAKTLGLLIHSENHGLTHPGAMFLFLLNRKEALDKYIMKSLRPTGNVLKSGS